MNPGTRAHLFRILQENNIPESLVAELMMERRNFRDSAMLAVLPKILPVQRVQGWQTVAAVTAYEVADAVLSVRDRPRGSGVPASALGPRIVNYDKRFEYARHLNHCPSVAGKGDEFCTCGVVQFLESLPRQT